MEEKELTLEDKIELLKAIYSNQNLGTNSVEKLIEIFKTGEYLDLEADLADKIIYNSVLEFNLLSDIQTDIQYRLNILKKAEYSIHQFQSEKIVKEIYGN